MRKAKDDGLLDVLDAFYRAAQGQEGWSDALRRSSSLFGAAASTIVAVDRSDGSLRFFAGHNVPDEGIAEYRDHVIHVDPRLRYVRAHPERDLFHDHLHHDERAMDHDEYYAWLQRIAGFRYYGAARIIDTEQVSAFFTVQRTPGEGPLDAADLDLFRRFAPHLKRCTEIACALGEADFRRAAAYEALHRLSTATILLDGTGRILFANAEGENILRSADVLQRTSDGCLAAVGRRTDNRLQQQIAGALGDLESPLQAVAREMAIDRAGRAAATLRLNPLLARERPIFGPDAAVVVFVHDPDTASPRIAARLRERFGLTPAEMALCRALLEGTSISDHARHAGIAIDTARSHLKRALAKTGTDRQASLVALLMREIPPTR